MMNIFYYITIIASLLFVLLILSLNNRLKKTKLNAASVDDKTKYADLISAGNSNPLIFGSLVSWVLVVLISTISFHIMNQEVPDCPEPKVCPDPVEQVNIIIKNEDVFNYYREMSEEMDNMLLLIDNLNTDIKDYKKDFDNRYTAQITQINKVKDRIHAAQNNRTEYLVRLGRLKDDAAYAAKYPKDTLIYIHD